MKITRFALRSKTNLIINSTDFITNKNWVQDWWYFESFHRGSFRGEQYGAFYCWANSKHARLLLNFCHFFLAKSSKFLRFGPGDLLQNPTMWFCKCVVPEKIYTPPPRKGFAIWPLFPLDFPKLPLKFTPPPPLRNFQSFCTPPGNFAISNIIEVNKEVVFFTTMPNFVSLMYFLLNSAFYYY